MNVETIYLEVIDLYKQEGYTLVPQSWGGGVHAIDGLETGFGINKSDIELFASLKKRINPKNIFIVGNAFGFSTFVLQNIFKEASIDVIDAETERKDNKLGSKITKNITKKKGFDINLTIGFSPQDTPKACRHEEYDLVFIDGLHSVKQLKEDFDGIKNRLSENAVIVCHDVKLCGLQGAIEAIEKENTLKGYYYKGVNYENSVGTYILEVK